MILTRIVELSTLTAICIAAITHLSRVRFPPWYDRIAFAAVAAGALWRAFDPSGYLLLLTGMALVFAQHFAVERRGMRKPPLS